MSFASMSAAVRAALRGLLVAALVVAPSLAPAGAATTWLKTVPAYVAPPAQNPSDLLPALANFNLTEPVNSNGQLYYDSFTKTGSCSSGAVSSTANGLANNTSTGSLARTISSLVGYSSPWMYLTAGEVHFVAPIWGAVTSPAQNSNHTREELRSLLTGTGSTKANDFIRDNRVQFTGSLRVVQMPSSGGRVHVAQIHADTTVSPAHGSGDTFMLLSVSASGTLSSTVSLAADPTQTYNQTTLIAGSVLGHTIQISFLYDTDDAIHWSVSKDGGAATNTTQGVESAWNGTNLYVKAGVYHATDVLCAATADYNAATGNGGVLAVPYTDWVETAWSAMSIVLLAP